MREKCPHSEFFWSVYSRIWTEYGEMWSIFPYSVRMRKIRTRRSPNTDISHSKANCDTYVVLLSKDSWKLSVIKTSWTSYELCICVQFTSLVYGLCSYFCTEFEVYSFILAEFRMRGGTFLFSMQNWDPKGPRRIEPKCIPPK